MKSKRQSTIHYLVSFQKQKNALKQQFTTESRFKESVQNPRIKNKFIPVFAVAVFGSSPNFRLTPSVLGQLMVLDEY